MGKDTDTRLREALAEVVLRRVGRLGHNDHDRQQSYIDLTDAILASLVEHRDDVLDVLGMEQVGWADGSEPGAPVLMSMHFTPKVPSLWAPVYAFRPKEQP